MSDGGFMKVFKKTVSIISTVVVIAVVILAVALVGVRVIGLTPMTVLSGSMEPAYHVGSLIYVKDIAPDKIEIGMPITFVLNEDLLVATHRVVNVERYDTKIQEVLDADGNPLLDEEGKTLTEEVPLDEPSYYFTTKGDANESEDGSKVYYKNVVGTPVFTLPYLGYLSSWLQTKKGMMIGACVALIILILTFVPDFIKSIDDGSNKKEEK